MKNTKNCVLINTEQDLESILKKKESMFILFYAPWCGFSQRFLPIFEKCALGTSRQCYRMMIDELPRLCERYQIEVYPTVIFFENGKPIHRIDGGQGIGLSEQQFRELIHVCEPPQ
jgi:thioredoxin-like negative regulator of GroEL